MDNIFDGISKQKGDFIAIRIRRDQATTLQNREKSYSKAIDSLIRENSRLKGELLKEEDQKLSNRVRLIEEKINRLVELNSLKVY